MTYSIIVKTETRILELYGDGQLYKKYSVAVGRPESPTPKGLFTVINKALNPGGPYGTRWLGLSKPHYGIHGTNEPESIGKAVSQGCVRMYNKDIEEVYGLVHIGASVGII